jgi:hypothetical protein
MLTVGAVGVVPPALSTAHVRWEANYDGRIWITLSEGLMMVNGRSLQQAGSDGLWFILSQS